MAAFFVLIEFLKAGFFRQPKGREVRPIAFEFEIRKAQNVFRIGEEHLKRFESVAFFLLPLRQADADLCPGEIRKMIKNHFAKETMIVFAR